jgi:hypothetical protein
MKVILLGLLCSLSFSIFAQTEKEAVDAFFDALIKSDYDLASQQMDTIELQKFHSFFVAIGQAEKLKNNYNKFAVGPFQKYKDIEEFKKVSPPKFFSDFLTFTLAQDQQMIQMLSNAKYKYVGSVKESDTASYAIIKFGMNLGGETIEMTDVVPLIYRNGSFKLGLKADMQIMAQAFKAQLSKT